MLRNNVTKANNQIRVLRYACTKRRKEPRKSGAPKLSLWECEIGSVWK